MDGRDKPDHDKRGVVPVTPTLSPQERGERRSAWRAQFRGDAYPRRSAAVCQTARVLARDGTFASSNRRGKETANWHRGRVLMWPSPRSHRITADGNAHRAAAGLNGRRGGKRRHAGAARQPTGPEQGPREPDGVPREAQPAPPGPVWYRPQGCRRGTRVPVAPPALLPGTDGAWAVEPVGCNRR